MNMQIQPRSVVYFIYANTKLKVLLGKLKIYFEKKMYNLKKSLSCLWIIIPVLAIIFGAYLVVNLLRNYQEVPTLIIIDKPIAVQSVVYPALTFCHPQTVLDFKARQFVKNMYNCYSSSI